MRNLKNIAHMAALLTQAADRQEQPPVYRFHGTNSPANRTKVPLLNSAPSAAVSDDGVATLRLYEPIDSWGGPWGVSALEFLETLDQLGDVSEIRLHINCPGGDVWESLAILNNLRQHGAKVTAIVDGLAASCASWIAVASDETIMSPNSQMMIHDALGICIGHAADMHKAGDRLDKISDNIASIYQVKSGGDADEWRNTMLAETWYTAQEAVDAGLADSIAGEDPGDKDKVEFDVKNGVGAKYANRAEAPAPQPPSKTQDRDELAPVPAQDIAARMDARRKARHTRSTPA